MQRSLQSRGQALPSRRRLRSVFRPVLGREKGSSCPRHHKPFAHLNTAVSSPVTLLPPSGVALAPFTPPVLDFPLSHRPRGGRSFPHLPLNRRRQARTRVRKGRVCRACGAEQGAVGSRQGLQTPARGQRGRHLRVRGGARRPARPAIQVPSSPNKVGELFPHQAFGPASPRAQRCWGNQETAGFWSSACLWPASVLFTSFTMCYLAAAILKLGEFT